MTNLNLSHKMLNSQIHFLDFMIKWFFFSFKKNNSRYLNFLFDSIYRFLLLVGIEIFSTVTSNKKKYIYMYNNK